MGEFLSKQKSKMLSKPLMVALGPAGRRQLVAVSRRNMGHVETGIDGFGRWTIGSQKQWMIGCAIFNTATLTILLANFGPYGNFINGIEHEPREEFRDYSYLRINAKNFPWGDGKHTLFFNEEALPLPGKGYIREEELHVPILITLKFVQHESQMEYQNWRSTISRMDSNSRS